MAAASAVNTKQYDLIRQRKCGGYITFRSVCKDKLTIIFIWLYIFFIQLNVFSATGRMLVLLLCNINTYDNNVMEGRFSDGSTAHSYFELFGNCKRTRNA